jgi:uncharacterized protein (DUF2062 family)
VKLFLHRHLVQPIVALLTQGVSPQKIALSLAVGLVVGIFPVLGTTTALCALAAVALKLNLPAVQLVNYVAYPLQFACLLPFIRSGEFLFRAKPINLSMPQMLEMAKADIAHAISILWVTALHAAAVWILVAPLLVFFLYRAFLWVIENAIVLRGRLQHHPTEAL